MYRALYRKWRPQVFADVIGQEAITNALKNQILNDKIGHAYMFTGTRGTGKTTCAKLFAKAVNCENPNGAEPCGECVSCLGMDDGSILDVVEIDAASNNGVDDVRELREETAYRPSRSRFRVYIIDEVHMLSTAAFNALLKILEEPPSHVIFILATTEIHKVPATILSRCQRFDFMRIPAEDIAARVQFVADEEKLGLEPQAADLIARLADGAMRDALSLLDTCAGIGQTVDAELVRRMAGVADKNYLFNISTAVQQKDTAALMTLVAGLRAQSVDVRRLCEELVHHYRNFMLVMADSTGALLESVPTEDRQRYIEEAEKISEKSSIKALRRLAAAMDKMGRSPDPRIELELALFDLCEQPEAALPPVQQTAPTAHAAPFAPSSPQPAIYSAPSVPQPLPVSSSAPMSAPAQVQETPQPPVQQVADEQIPTATPAAEVPFDITETKIAVTPQADSPDLSPANEPQVMDNSIAAEIANSNEPPPQAKTEEAQAAAPAPIANAEAPDGVQPFSEWSEVINLMAGIDRMLYSYMKGSSAFLDGGRVLIQAGDMFLSFMRENEFAAERIKTVIQQVTGKRYGIGPYKAAQGGAQNQMPTARETLKKWEEMGVEVKYE